ncbi:MAG: glycosyltransferase family 4 protein [Planctomycetota bacterium]
MRILYHHRTKSRDGQYVHIAEMQAALRRRGHEVREVAPAALEPVVLGGESASLARLARYFPSSLREILEWGYNLVSLGALDRVLESWRPDLIYERYAMGNVAGVLMARWYRIPLFLEVNAPLALERAKFGGLTFPGLVRRLEAFTLRQADRVLAVTAALAAILVAEGAEPARVTVVPNGVDLRRFRGVGPAEGVKRALGLEGRTVLGFVGFCREWHRLDRIVRLLARGYPELQSTHLLVVGDGPARAGLAELARSLGVADRVTFTGVVARDELARYIAAIDVALQPDVVEYASPLKLFEYLALGKAVVAPDRANIREVVTDGETALLFDPSREEALAGAIARLVNDPPLRARLGARGRSLIETHPYTWDRNAERLEELVVTVQTAGRCA